MKTGEKEKVFQNDKKNRCISAQELHQLRTQLICIIVKTYFIRLLSWLINHSVGTNDISLYKTKHVITEEIVNLAKSVKQTTRIL